MSKAMLGIALIALNRGANAEIAHDEVAGFLQLLLTPAAVGDQRAPTEAEGGADYRVSSSGSLAKLLAMRRASSRVSTPAVSVTLCTPSSFCMPTM